MDSPFAHQAFAEKLHLNFPLLSDFNREVIPQYTGFYDDVSGLKQVGKRAVFVVDRNGVVRYKWTTEQPGNIPDVNEVLQVVRSIQD